MMLLVGLAIGVSLGCAGTYCAYRNGVTDGFGFCIEPNNPGYRKAGLYLVARESHRWGYVLKNPMYSKVVGTALQKNGSLL